MPMQSFAQAMEGGYQAERSMEVGDLQKQYLGGDVKAQSDQTRAKAESEVLKLSELKDNIRKTGVGDAAISEFFKDPANSEAMTNDPIGTMGKLVAETAKRGGKLDAIEKLANVVSNMEKAESTSMLKKAQTEALRHTKNNDLINALVPDDAKMEDLGRIKDDFIKQGGDPAVAQIFANELKSGKTIPEAKRATLAQTRTAAERKNDEANEMANKRLDAQIARDEEHRRASIAREERFMATISGKTGRDVEKSALDSYSKATSRLREITQDRKELKDELKDMGTRPESEFKLIGPNDDTKGKEWDARKIKLMNRDKDLQEDEDNTRRFSAQAMKKVAKEDLALISKPKESTTSELQTKVEATGQKYEPTKYNYRIAPDGSVQRKLKG